ncbi:GGDEF domain-containing protein [Zoogloeaceae bacterium G21618-S1]|nr:GGDEF domain-containing protein [Zoogloeaceae bacterium G21618-S1]
MSLAIAAQTSHFLETLATLCAERDRACLLEQFCAGAMAALCGRSAILFRVDQGGPVCLLTPIGWCVSDMRGGDWDRNEAVVSKTVADPLLKQVAQPGVRRQIDAEGDHWRIAWPIGDGRGPHWVVEVRSSVSPDAEVLAGMSGLVRGIDALLGQWRHANLDPLTGLLNRRTFDDQFVELIAEAGRLQRGERVDDAEKKAHPCWLGIVDIDHFKCINDREGHAFGDEVLAFLGGLIKRAFRANDKVFRFGGEEFVVMLRDASEEGVHEIFDRFRAKVAETAFPRGVSVTCSVGYARVDPLCRPVELVARADEAMYCAKAKGRNRSLGYEQLVMSGALKALGSGARPHGEAELFLG